MVHTVRSPARATISLEHVQFNRHVSADHVIAANYFGRMCSFWRVLSRKWLPREGLYGHVFKTCLSLTNVSMMVSTLRFEGDQNSTGVYNRLLAISMSQIEWVRGVQVETTENFHARMSIGTRCALLDDSDTK